MTRCWLAWTMTRSWLQFGHAQRAWDDKAQMKGYKPQVMRLQFGHAQRAWDDQVALHVPDTGRNASIRPRPEGVG